MVNFPLVCAVRLGNVFANRAVVVPFDVVDGILVQKCLHLVVDAVHNLWICKVQMHLVTCQTQLFVIQIAKNVLGMFTEKLRVGVYHFRLEPNTKLDANFLAMVNNLVQIHLGFVHKPIAKAGVIVVTVAKPTVIQSEPKPV